MQVYHYCPRCGHGEFWRYGQGEGRMCQACGKVTELDRLCGTRRKCDELRLLTAVLWLADQYGEVTRSEVACHLGVTNSPHFRRVLSVLAGRHVIRERWGLYAQNQRPTLFYGRNSGHQSLVERPTFQVLRAAILEPA